MALRRFSLTAAAVAAVCGSIVPRSASAQKEGAPGAGTRKVLITAFRGDRDAGQKVADEIRNRIAGGFDIRSLMPTSKKDIEMTLTQANYRPDSAFSPNDLKELAKLVRADEVIDGTIARSGSGYRVTARMFLPRDIALSQPLMTDASVKDLADAATAIVAEYAHARAQIQSNQACETAIRANQNAVAIAAARKGIRSYPRAVLLRLCMANAYANMRVGADSTQPWKDSVIAITREILKLDKHCRIAYQLQYDVYKAKHDTANALAAVVGISNSGSWNATYFTEPPFGGSAELAVLTARRLLADNPGDPQYARTYWLVLRAAKHFKESVPAGMAYVAIDTAAADSNYFFRQLADLEADSSYAKAAEMAAIGSAKYPRSTSLLLQKAQNERRAGQLSAAKASLQRALEIDPNVNGANYLLASISAEMNDADDAIKYMKDDAALNRADRRRDAVDLMQLGSTLYKVAMASKTADDYKKAVSLFHAAGQISGAQSNSFLAYSAFQPVAASMGMLRTSTSCEDFKAANDLLTIVNINMPALSAEDPDVAKRIMAAAMLYAPFFEDSIKKYCK